MTQATIGVNDGRIDSHVGSTPSTGPFVFDFPIEHSGSVIVWLKPDATGLWQVLTYGIDYTVARSPVYDDGFAGGGTITLVAAVSNTTVRRFRDTTIERTSNFPLEGYFSRLALNSDFNRFTMALQDFQRRLFDLGGAGDGSGDNESIYQLADPTLTALAALDPSAGLVEQNGADSFVKRAIGVAAVTSIPTRADGDARWAPISHSQDWSTITGTPATFPPAAHTQDWSTITGTPATFPPAAHTHAQSEITSLVSDLAAKAPLVSPTFTGTPAAPNVTYPAASSTQISNLKYVNDAVAAATGGGPFLPISNPTFTGTMTGPNYTAPAATDATLNAPTGQRVNLAINGVNIVRVQSSAMFPNGDATVDLGSSALRYANYWISGNLTWGSASTDPSLRRNGAGLMARAGDGSGMCSFDCANFSVQAANAMSWVSRTTMRSPADAQLRLVNNAETIGVLLDFTTDAVLRLKDRTGAADATILVANLGIGSAGWQSWSGRAAIRAPADGVLRYGNGAESAGIQIDYGTGTLKVRNFANNADAEVTHATPASNDNSTKGATTAFVHADQKLGSFTATGGSFTATSGVDGVLAWGTVLTGNEGSWLSTSTNRWTPPAGRYWISCTAGCQAPSGGNGTWTLKPRKNGTVITGTGVSGSGSALFSIGLSCSLVVDMNGTDFIDWVGNVGTTGMNAQGGQFAAMRICA